MTSLWRAMALIWLGGVVSPSLGDDPAILLGAPIAGTTREIHADGAPAATSEATSELEKRGGVASTLRPVTKI